MSFGDNVRSKINVVELALKETDADNAIRRIVVVLKEIASALDDVEGRAKHAVSSETRTKL